MGFSTEIEAEHFAKYVATCISAKWDKFVVTGQCGDPFVCLGRAGRGASLPQPAVEHSGCDAHACIYCMFARV